MSVLDGVGYGQSRADFAYWGDRRDWLAVLAITRDSSCLEESNFCTAQKLLRDGGYLENEDWAVERSSHWLCGWIDTIIVDPANADAVTVGQGILRRLEDYPVLDEEDWCERESAVVNVGVAEAIYHQITVSSVTRDDCADIANYFLHETDGDWNEQSCWPEFGGGDYYENRNRRELAAALWAWRKSKREEVKS